LLGFSNIKLIRKNSLKWQKSQIKILNLKKYGNILKHKGGKYIARGGDKKINLIIEPCFIVDTTSHRKNDLLYGKNKEVGRDLNWKRKRLIEEWEKKLSEITSNKTMNLMPAMRQRNKNLVNKK